MSQSLLVNQLINVLETPKTSIFKSFIITITMKPTQNKMSTDMNMPYLLQSHLHRDAIAYIPYTYIDIV